MSGRDLVVFGDSVTWGQGLGGAHKMSAIVADRLGLQERMVAHSGAIIGIGAPLHASRADGEVPVPRPTILQEVRDYGGDPANADVLILNGGINDVDIRFILNPIIPLSELSRKTSRHCHEDMLTLLGEIGRKFTSPDLRIVVTSYFPILSSRSDPFCVPFFLAIQGVAMSPIVPTASVFGKVAIQCVQFWRESTASLQAAVRECGDARVRFADVPFTEDNAVFAPDAWLFGIDIIPPFLPQDEVVPERRAACDVTFPPIDIVDREACYRASAGHPNARGAAAFAGAILDVL